MEAAVEVASNLRDDDRREVVEGHGHFPLFSIPQGAFNGESHYYKAPNGKIAAIGGIQSEGRIWMLCTPIVEEYPIAFARVCKRMIESRKENILWNIVDKRNVVHLRLLKFLGFKFLREFKHGPNQLTFIEFCRVRTSINSHVCSAGRRVCNETSRPEKSSKVSKPS